MIYFLQREPDGIIKIGWSCDIPRRMKQLVRRDTSLILLGVCVGGYEYEQQLHKRFSSYRLVFERRRNKEWYHPAQPILDFIKTSTVFWRVIVKWNDYSGAESPMRFDIEADPEVRRYNKLKQQEENARKYQEWLLANPRR